MYPLQSYDANEQYAWFTALQYYNIIMFLYDNVVKWIRGVCVQKKDIFRRMLVQQPLR
jgi:hypothetical protein